jgi:hypothetical protein
MITDGLFTIIGAIFGSPMGTVIYFGHPIHKKIGGKAAFSFANGILYLIYTPTPDPNSNTSPNPRPTPDVNPNPNQASSTSSSACRAPSPFLSTPFLRWPTGRLSSSSA